MRIDRQNKTPIVAALLKYSKEKTIPFHVPGHKQGKGNRDLKKLLGPACLKIDLTCMEDLDNICTPVSVIKEAEALAAELYGAENAFFLVNGTTGGIQAMIMSVCNPGDKIIIPRNAHKSAIGGLILSGAEPVYVEPEINEQLGIAMGVRPETVARALESHPDAKAVFMINPTYYGIASDLKSIVEIAHSFQIPVIVDEAHGAHLNFDKNLPLSAMEAGADLAASSTHKLGGSLTQSSLLLHQGQLIKPQKVKAALNLTQTTSPSYLLLASLDIARRQLAGRGKEMINKAWQLSVWAREEISKIEGLYVMGEEVLGQLGCYSLDPTKIVINVKALGLSGYEAEKILRKKYHIQVELSDLLNIIVLVSIGDDKRSLSRLIEALAAMAEAQSHSNVVKYFIPLPAIPEAVVSPREAFYGESRTVPLNEAEGEISAEMVMAYPPGIPIVCPGERITREIIDYINILKNEAAELQGTEDPEVGMIRVLNRRLVLIQNEETLNQQVI
ncbi:MAG: aminotransferase class I/II-fold pyridoxal phosphate-dependent enzyme [Peptococcaceae bacterium]|nr:aminotransferase class I/II-fold pyridoxal phosphate-dependent enzyme [Peptococcaceae bacterium]MDH7524130.1 aminotransferase class I/II-fold pyridoxal phosphate-dependent enzyme [Peptococcaceae bacterium]